MTGKAKWYDRTVLGYRRADTVQERVRRAVWGLGAGITVLVLWLALMAAYGYVEHPPLVLRGLFYLLFFGIPVVFIFGVEVYTGRQYARRRAAQERTGEGGGGR